MDSSGVCVFGNKVSCQIPAYQEKGIGTEIIRRLLYYLKEQTPENGRTSIQLIAETGKEQFYEKFGFESVPNGTSGSGMRMIIRK